MEGYFNLKIILVVESVKKVELLCDLLRVKQIDCVIPFRLTGGMFAVYQQLSNVANQIQPKWRKHQSQLLLLTTLQGMRSLRHICYTWVSPSMSTWCIYKSWQSFLKEYWIMRWCACLCADFLAQWRGSCSFIAEWILCLLKSCWLKLGRLWRMRLQWKNQSVSLCNLPRVLSNFLVQTHLLFATSAVDPIISQVTVPTKNGELTKIRYYYYYYDIDHQLDLNWTMAVSYTRKSYLKNPRPNLSWRLQASAWSL